MMNQVRGSPKPAAGLPRIIWSQIGVAHRDHNPQHNTESNLAAWCDWCHLAWDKAHHKDTRSARKDSQRPLIAGQEEQHEEETTATNSADSPTNP
jgi:hypothetical protein